MPSLHGSIFCAYNRRMDEFTDLCRRWGTDGALADDIGEKLTTVRGWRQRNRIPQDAWAEVIRASRRRNWPVTAEELVRWADKWA